MEEPKRQKWNILLYGLPGTGKTSFINAFSNYTQRHIIYLRISDFSNIQETIRVFFNERVRYTEGTH